MCKIRIKRKQSAEFNYFFKAKRKRTQSHNDDDENSDGMDTNGSVSNASTHHPPTSTQIDIQFNIIAADNDSAVIPPLPTP